MAKKSNTVPSLSDISSGDKQGVTVLESVVKRPMWDIALDKIIVDEKDNTREKIDVTTEEFKGFVIDIRNRGIIEPVVVRPTGKDMFKVVAGYRRTLGAGHHTFEFEGNQYDCKPLATVPCVVLEGADDAEALETNIVENGQREDITPYETATGLWRLEKLYKAKGFKLSAAQMAEKLGMSTSYVYKLLQSKNLSPSWQKAWKEGSIKTPKAFSLAAEDKDKQQEEYDNWLQTKQSSTGDGGSAEGAEGKPEKEKKPKRMNEEKLRLFMADFEVAPEVKVSGKWIENDDYTKKVAKMVLRTALGELEKYPLRGHEPEEEEEEEEEGED